MFCPCRSVRTQMCHGRGPPRSCPPRPVQSTLMMSGSLRSGAASWTTCISTGSVTPFPPSNLRDVTALSVSLFPVLSMSRTPEANLHIWHHPFLAWLLQKVLDLSVDRSHLWSSISSSHELLNVFFLLDAAWVRSRSALQSATQR